MESLVILEFGSELPAFVDDEAGSESNVTVLAERPGEGAAAFAARALLWLERGAVDTARGLLVCGVETGRERTSARGALLCALSERSERVGITSVGQRPDVSTLARMLRVEHRVVHGPQPLREPERTAAREWTRRVA